MCKSKKLSLTKFAYKVWFSKIKYMRNTFVAYPKAFPVFCDLTVPLDLENSIDEGENARGDFHVKTFRFSRL